MDERKGKEVGKKPLVEWKAKGVMRRLEERVILIAVCLVWR